MMKRNIAKQQNTYLTQFSPISNRHKCRFHRLLIGIFINKSTFIGYMELDLIFSRFNPWWQDEYKVEGIIREHYINLLLTETKEKNITFVTGLRRVGKTTLLKQLIHQLIKQKIDAKHILFISLDHSALANVSILDLVEKYRQFIGLSFKEKIYLFFDEIQYHDNFERDIKVLHDNENVKIFASGSNSLILKDKNAFLTGRNKNIIINPLSFEEYLLFKGLSIVSSEKQLIKKYFEDYLELGGMPEYVLTNDPEKITSLVSNIIYKDIVGKHNIKNAKKIEELFLLLCERIGKRLTYNKLANILSIDAETVSSYISYFEEAFLVYSINRYAASLNEVVHSPKKIYLADNGIRSVFVGFKDKGALWENLVFSKIRGKKVSYYYENEHEIDFIVEIQQKRECIAIEAKYKENLEKEELEFFKNSKFKKKLIVQYLEDFNKIEELLSIR